MANLERLQKSVDALRDDLGTFFVSIQIKLDAVKVSDPAEQAKIDAVADEVDAMKAKVDGFGAAAPAA